MLRNAVLGARLCQSAVNITLKRNFGLTAVACKTAAQTDPIQQLFVEKIREYKSKSSGDKLVDATPEVEKQLQDQMEKVARTYGAVGHDFSKFPTFSFQDPALQAVGVEVSARDEVAAQVEEVESAPEADPYYVYP